MPIISTLAKASEQGRQRCDSTLPLPPDIWFSQEDAADQEGDPKGAAPANSDGIGGIPQQAKGRGCQPPGPNNFLWSSIPPSSTDTAAFPPNAGSWEVPTPDMQELCRPSLAQEDWRVHQGPRLAWKSLVLGETHGRLVRPAWKIGVIKYKRQDWPVRGLWMDPKSEDLGLSWTATLCLPVATVHINLMKLDGLANVNSSVLPHLLSVPVPIINRSCSSQPRTHKNGEIPVAELKTNSAQRTCFTQSDWLLRQYVWRNLLSSWMVRSACLFDCGWYPNVRLMFNFRWENRARHTSEVNWGPWSDRMSSSWP